MRVKGNALIELVLGLGLFTMSLSALLLLINAGSARWAALEVADLGVSLQIETAMNPESIKNMLLQELKRKRLPLAPQWTVDISAPTSSPAFRFYDLAQAVVTAELPGPLTIEEKVAAQREAL
jgi:hypothetical protein